MSSPHEKRMVSLAWHPLAANVLVTSAMDKAIKLWDVEAGMQAKVTLSGIHGDAVSSISWNHDGTQMATTSKDKKMRVIDPRSAQVAGVRLP